MSKLKIYCASVVILFPAFAIKAQDFDPEAISEVSKAIAEWKLMNDSEAEEPPVYVSSSLAPVVEKAGSEGIGVVHGLAAFGDSYWLDWEMKQWRRNNRIQSQIRRWELESTAQIGRISQLPTNPWTDIGTSVAGKITIDSIGSMYGSMGRRAGTIMGSAIGAADTLYKTIDYVGRSMQTINPPRYLQHRTSWGSFGHGSFEIDGMRVTYYEALDTSASHWRKPGSITRRHAEHISTDFGDYYRTMEITTPATSPFERFMMHNYPVGSYFDPMETTIRTTTTIREKFRIESYGGIDRITPLPDTGMGKWNTTIGVDPYQIVRPTATWNRMVGIDTYRVGTGIGKWNTRIGMDPYRIGTQMGRWDRSVQQYYNRIGVGSRFYVPSYARPRTSYSTIGQRH